MTYVRTKVGFVYTAFVTDVFSRKIVGWSTRSSMKTEALPLEALDQAIAQARGNLEGLVHHSDHGSQYVSIVYNDTLTGLGIKASTGTVGDSYDNALAETVNGLYKTELIYTGQWESLAELEFATLVAGALAQHRSPPSGTGLPDTRRGHPHLQSTPDTNTGDHPLKETEQNLGRFTL